MGAEVEAARANLTLLPTGELRADAPQSYAEALVQLDERRQELDGALARAARLAQENEHLTTALGKAHAKVERIQAQLHKDLRLHRDYEAVERLWREVWKPAHPKAGEQVPQDWLKMALDRLKDFDEAALARALYGVIRNPQVNDKTGAVYDQWDNALRSTGHVNRHVAYADAFEGKAHRERERHPEVARVLGELRVGRLEDLANRCDNCGELMILHAGETRPGPLGVPVCGDPDDSQFRFDRSCEARERAR